MQYSIYESVSIIVKDFLRMRLKVILMPVGKNTKAVQSKNWSSFILLPLPSVLTKRSHLVQNKTLCLYFYKSNVHHRYYFQHFG